jgi:hypothetical protein
MVRFYEKMLVTIRQDDVRLEKETVPGSEWTSRLQAKLKERKVKNIDRCCSLLKELYPYYVESYREGGSGSADEVRGYQGLLVQKESQGGSHAANLVRTLQRIMDSESNLEDQIKNNSLFMGPSVGREAHWLTLFKTGDPGWKDAATKYVASNKEKLIMDSLVSEIRSLGALPLADPFLFDILGTTALQAYERMAFTLAVGHLNSWESWRHNLTARTQDLEAELEKLGNPYSERDSQTLICIEQKREEQIKRAGNWAEKSAYLITEREIKNWKKLKGITDQRERIVQAGDHGSTILLDLAKEAFDDPDAVFHWAKKNKVLKKIQEAKELPMLTFPDAETHPRFTLFSGLSNRNNPPYTLKQNEQGLCVDLPLFSKDSDGVCIRKFFFQIAPTYQLRLLKMWDDKKKQYLSYESQDNIQRKVSIAGGASLILSPRFVSDPTSAWKLRDGRPGAMAYLMLSVNVETEEHKTKIPTVDRRDIARYLSKSKITRSAEKKSPIVPGIRIMAVHLGIRVSATCSIFEVGAEKSTDPLWSVEGHKIHHEQTFLLRMPAEKAIEGRKEAQERLWRIGRELDKLSGLRQLHGTQDPEVRKELLNGMRGKLDKDVHRELSILYGCPHENWERIMRPIYFEEETRIAKDIHDWRQEKMTLGGKSIWRIAYLEKTRDLIRAWDRHSRPDYPVRRMEKSTQGVVASRLLVHIQNLKMDRIKTLTAFIIEAAKGNTYSNKSWSHTYTPVDIIVLGDLTRYRITEDQDLEENVRLAQWSHRSIAQEIERRAKAEGFAIGKAPVAFSSIFSAGTRTPGIACYEIKSDEEVNAIQTQGHWLRPFVKEAKLDLLQLKRRDLIPVPGGPYLVTSDGSRIHVDVNAAQNHGMNYLTGSANPVRAVAYETDGHLLNLELGKILQGHFKSDAVEFFKKDGNGTYTAMATKKIDVKINEKNKMVLFRDPSGTFFDPSVWVQAAVFWKAVEAKSYQSLG